jgi:hypothetical protein
MAVSGELHNLAMLPPVSDPKSKEVFKIQKKVVRLICSVNRRWSCRELFKSVNILPVPCVYVMETV